VHLAEDVRARGGDGLLGGARLDQREVGRELAAHGREERDLRGGGGVATRRAFRIRSLRRDELDDVVAELEEPADARLGSNPPPRGPVVRTVCPFTRSSADVTEKPGATIGTMNAPTSPTGPRSSTVRRSRIVCAPAGPVAAQT
jgi:hypothetical protein